MGTTVRELIELAGGVIGGAAVGAVQPGGASSNLIGPDQLDLRLDFDTAAKAGTMLGSGAVVVMAEGTNLLAASTNVLRFFRNESCGKCVPCRVGSTKAHELLHHIVDSGSSTVDEPTRTRILELEEVMRKTSICGLGQVALGPVVSVMGFNKGGAVAEEQAQSHQAHVVSGREFFNVVTVSEALAGFRPSRRTNIESVPLAAGIGTGRRDRCHCPRRIARLSSGDRRRIRRAAPPTRTAPPKDCPRTSLSPARCAWAPLPSVAVAPGTCVAIPTGAVIPDGADAVVMVEYTAETMKGTIEVTRPVAPGAGLVRADEDVAAGAVLVHAGRPLRAAELGLLAAAGVATVDCSRPTEGGHHLDGRRGGPAFDQQAGRRAGTRRDGVRPGRSHARSGRRSGHRGDRRRRP